MPRNIKAPNRRDTDARDLTLRARLVDFLRDFMRDNPDIPFGIPSEAPEWALVLQEIPLRLPHIRAVIRPEMPPSLWVEIGEHTKCDHLTRNFTKLDHLKAQLVKVFGPSPDRIPARVANLDNKEIAQGVRKHMRARLTEFMTANAPTQWLIRTEIRGLLGWCGYDEQGSDRVIDEAVAALRAGKNPFETPTMTGYRTVKRHWPIDTPKVKSARRSWR